MSEYSDSEDVLDLLMPMYSGADKNEYGKETVPPIPLFFDRINEGRPPQSNSLLFRLPFEILEEVTLYLSESSLSDLSLVSKDCCQLARSCRFSSVRFNYSIPQSHLIEKLLEEASERVVNNGSTVSSSIGACFRRLQIATDAQWVSYRLDIGLEEVSKMEEVARKKRVREAYSLFFGDYLLAIELILIRALPHLEALDIQDHIPLPPSFFNALACSSIQHLKLFRVHIKKEFEIALPKALARRGWPLRSLHLELTWPISSGTRGSSAPLCTSILQLCAPTLERFAWVKLSMVSREDGQSLAKEDSPRFLQLRELALDRVEFTDESSLDLLIFSQSESRLRVLEADAGHRSLIGQYLERCGPIRTLETFVWNASGLKPNHPFTFLRQNSQLSKLSLQFRQTPAVLDEGILPILSRSFQKLKSLSLTWESTSISTTALQLIGTLRSLEQIHLSTGHQSGWRHNWVINHQEMRKHLKELQHLKKVAFSRDSYAGLWGFEEADYTLKSPIFEDTPEDLLGLDELNQEERRDQVWERQHRRRILTEADEYVQMLPKLEWMYFGQIPMGVINGKEGQGRQAVALSQERDECWTLLRRMFGRETADN